MGKQKTVSLSVDLPTEQSAREALGRQAAAIHAEAAFRYIQSLSCCRQQKLAILDGLAERGHGD